jgi:NAD(P)-dependent dehydrogenase (short-subunit alcohol dehydrogenase family)
VKKDPIVPSKHPAAPARTAVYPSLAGKRVVVTGGGSGIGASIVEAFARQGAETIFVDILENESNELVRRLADLPIATRFHRLDLTDLAAIESFFRTVGGVDVLVNNAGNDDRHTLQDITPDYWDERMAMNLRHMVFAAKAVAPGMQARGAGAIINLGSIAWHLGLPDLLLYETAKAGILGLTRGLARELGPANIRVTSVVPGNVKTPRQSKWYTAKEEAEIVAQQCLKQRLMPADVSALVLFLASDDARMCTAHEYWIDAGWG